MSDNRFGTIVQIGDILVSEEVITEWFACDYEKCRGCCCVVGDSGAPLQESEAEQLEAAYSAYSPLMTPEGRAAVAENGFFEIDREGDMVTPVIHKAHRVSGLDSIPGTDGLVGISGLEDCAFIRYEQDAEGHANCFCAVERCFFQGKCRLRKPLSCWLYPIRVKRFRGGGEALNLHRWNICADAYEKGRREGIRAYEFLREPLVAAYGTEFYEALQAAARHILG